MTNNVFANVKGLLFDLDGVFYVGDRPIAGAIDTIRYLKKRNIPCRFMTNTTTRSLNSLEEKVAGLGLPIESNEIFGVIRAAQQYLRREDRPKCWVLLTEGPKGDFSEFEQTEDNPTHIILGDMGKTWDHELMQKCFEKMMAGAKLIALHKGRYWETENGLRMDIGAFVAGLEYVTQKEAVVIGKPSKEFFDLAIKDMGLSSSEVVMIGDDINSDIGGAQQAGLKGVLVKTGKYREELVKQSDVAPDMVIDSVAMLQELL
jgi:HAD superfamily hydrolase (TIGR01458 family)